MLCLRVQLSKSVVSIDVDASGKEVTESREMLTRTMARGLCLPLMLPACQQLHRTETAAGDAFAARPCLSIGS